MDALPVKIRTHANCGTVLCEPDWFWRPRLEDMDLWYIWHGRGEMCIDDGREVVALHPGVMMCLRPGHRYNATHDPRHRLGACYLHFDYYDAAGQVCRPSDAELPPHHCVMDNVDFHEQVLRQAARLAQSRSAVDREQAACYLGGALLAMRSRAAAPTLSPTERERHETISAITQHIRERPGELFSVDDLARRAGYSVDHFTRLFARIMGMTPKEFCIRSRMERAQQLLRESTLSIDAIAQALGYADVFFFSRQFKQRVGVTPSRWRKGP